MKRARPVAFGIIIALFCTLGLALSFARADESSGTNSSSSSSSSTSGA